MVSGTFLSRYHTKYAQVMLICVCCCPDFCNRFTNQVKQRLEQPDASEGFILVRDVEGRVSLQDRPGSEESL